MALLSTACVFDRKGTPVEPPGPHPDSLVDVGQALDTAGQTDTTGQTDSAADATPPDTRKDTTAIDADGAAPDTAAPSDLMPWPKPLAHWRFDKGSGSTAYDSVGTSHGTIVSASWTSSGYMGNALVFNGSSSYVNIPHSGKLNLTGALSIVAWIKADGVADRQVIISKTASGNNTWLFEINPIDFTNGTANFYLNTAASAGGGSNFGSKTAVAKGAWQHLACVFDGNSRHIYLDGTLDNSASHTGTIFTNTLPIRIGRWSSTGRFFKGTIDEVAIFDAALSSTEVKQIYTNGL